MFNIDPIVNNFLGGIPTMEDKKSDKPVLSYPLNALRPLALMLEQEEHNAQFQRVLDIVHSEVPLAKFQQLVKDEIERLELKKEIIPRVESFKALGGKNLSPFIYSHRIWGLHSLYTSYDFAHKSYEEVQDIYNHRIGSIALDGIEEITLMKQKEQTTGDDIHDYKFYEDTERARTRGIEFLIAGSKQNSEYFNKLYMDSSIGNLLQNFFHIHATDPLEADCLYVVRTKEAGMVMQYKNETEDISFQAITFRNLRTIHSLDSFETGAKKLQQLKNLDGPSRNSQYTSKLPSSKSKTSTLMIKPIVEELDAQLYEQVQNFPHEIKEEEQLELKAHTKLMRRYDGNALDDVKDNKATTTEAHIPNPFMQSCRNRAVSAKIAKNGLNLTSDYNTPPVEILSDFFATLPIDTDDEKLFASIITITTAIGSQISYIVDMLIGNKTSVLKHKDSKLTVQIDKSIFASPSSTKFLGSSDNNISFITPHLMDMQISNTKNNIKKRDKTLDKDELIEECKDYLKNCIKQFHKNISFPIETLHRPLKSYVKAIGADALTANFATATYHTNERAKMAYNATKKDSQTHSNLINNFCMELNFDGVARDILGIGGEIFATKAITVAKPKYAGSSKCADVAKTKEFFTVLDENIKIATIAEDDDTLFKLATIKMGYSMNLLAGTRSFNNSTDFSSWSYALGTITISEKANSIAAGLRIIPICDKLNEGLKSYSDTFLKPRGLKQKICFYNVGKDMPFNQHSTKKVLNSISNLSKRAVLEEYVQNVPTNTGRHCISKKATELSIPTEFISTFLGHNFSGSEQFGIYSTLDTKQYYEDMKFVTSFIATEFGIGGLSW